MQNLAGPDARDVDQLTAMLLDNPDPEECPDRSPERLHHLDRITLETVQLLALRKRFERFRDRIPMLTKLADEVGVTEIRAIEDVAPILFKHTVYKSYPVALLEQSRFSQMMQWLNKLTLFDLSNIDVSHCQSIDQWVAELDARTPIGLLYSSGTGGVMSFIPRSREEAERQFLRNMGASFRSFNLVPPSREAPLSMHVILANYRSGSPAWARNNDYRVKYFCGGDESKVVALYPGRVSADILFLAGRIRSAQQKGELERLKLSPTLLAKKAEVDSMQRRGPADQQAFYDRIIAELQGKQIAMQGPSSALYNIAAAGLSRGHRKFFASNSVVIAGGGAKGQVVPDDWEDQVCGFFGVERVEHLYGMSEVQGGNHMCEYRRYHIAPTNIMFLMDPDTGETLPRSGVQTGRAAFYDLMASTYWGGFISGDELTVDWDTPCRCGRLSAHIDPRIERYSDKRGGDDKISCAAASEAHEAALDFLVGVDG